MKEATAKAKPAGNPLPSYLKNNQTPSIALDDQHPGKRLIFEGLDRVKFRSSKD